jgi:pimeloyl-ACP methyl ester carboxylesterase
MSRLAFFHANGYPPGVYKQLFSALQSALTESGSNGKIVAAPFLETAVDCKADLRWPTMLGIAQHHAALNQANVLIGHSMGGYIALQVAASAPEKIKQIILIDSPIPRSWRSGLLSFSKATGLSYKFGPAPVAHGRRDLWPDRASAKEHFAKKGFVQRWADGVLDDFVAHALSDDAAHPGNRVTLTIPRMTERDIYANIVHTEALRALHRVRSAGVRVRFIAGAESDEMRLAGYASNQALFSPDFVELDHVGHLIPMEAHERCANAIAEVLKQR